MENHWEREDTQENEPDGTELHPFYVCRPCGTKHSGWDFCPYSEPIQCEKCLYFGHPVWFCDNIWEDERMLGRCEQTDDEDEREDQGGHEEQWDPEDWQGENQDNPEGREGVWHQEKGDDEDYEENEWHDEENEVWQPYRCRPCGVYHDARHWCEWSQPRRCYQCNLFGHLARACELWDFEQMSRRDWSVNGQKESLEGMKEEKILEEKIREKDIPLTSEAEIETRMHPELE